MSDLDTYKQKLKKYSLFDLTDIKFNIDRDKYPEKYELVLEEIENREIGGEKLNNDPKYKQKDIQVNLNYTKTRTSNPALNKNTFYKINDYHLNGRMSLQGVVNRAALLISIVILSASFAWIYCKEVVNDSAFLLASLLVSIMAFIIALVTIKDNKISNFTSPLYAILEGICLGIISAIFEQKYPGIVIQAVALTFGTFIGLLFAYTTRLIKPSENFKLGITSATFGIGLLYLVSIISRFFGHNIQFIHESGFAGISFSIFVVIIAALNLVLDFDFIEAGVKHGAPKYMEWYSAFGLLLTLVWLYLEILRLLSKVRSRK